MPCGIKATAIRLTFRSTNTPSDHSASSCTSHHHPFTPLAMWLPNLFKRSTAYLYMTRAGDDEYRRDFGRTSSSQCAVALLGSEMRAVNDHLKEAGFASPIADPLVSIAISFERRCDVIQDGVSPVQRFLTILVPTLVYEALAFFLPIEIDNLGFLAAGAGTLIFTLLLAFSLVILFPPADTSLALDHALARLLPPLPALLAFYLTLVPGLVYLRSNVGYRIGAIILQVLGLSAFRYWGLVREFFFLRFILRKTKLSLEQKRKLAARAVPLLRREKCFVDDADRRSATGTITDHMTMAITPLKSDSGLFIRVLVALIQVRAPRLGPPIWPKLFLVFLTGVIGGINIYAYRDEPLTATDKIGWTIVGVLTMLSFALSSAYSLIATVIQFMKLIVGTIINTVLVTTVVLATEGKVLQSPWKLVLVAAGNTIALLAVSHLISQWFGKAAMALAKFISKSDPDTERQANFDLFVKRLEDFATGDDGGEEIPL
ncbi:hypothetical protein ACCS93_35745 [Rhizobium ruizarguesonis]